MLKIYEVQKIAKFYQKYISFGIFEFFLKNILKNSGKKYLKTKNILDNQYVFIC